MPMTTTEAEDVRLIRRADYTLDEEQQAVRESFRAYFTKAVDAARVRAAEPEGFDAQLWAEVGAQRVIDMGLPEHVGGDGAGLVDLALVAEEAGRCAAPIPLVEAVVGARALARLVPSSQELSDARSAGLVVSVAPVRGAGRSLVPAGATAGAVVACDGNRTVLVVGPSAPMVKNLACAPLGWWNLTGGTAIGSAADFCDVLRDWRLLTAAAMVGLGQAAVDMGVQYANERSAFGTAIGAFQAIANPLVDAASAVEGARRLVWRAAWYADHEPEALGALAISAFLSAAVAAEKAGAVAIHTQGGFGLTMESDAQLYYRRAKGWAAIAGDRRSLLREVADVTLTPMTAVQR